MNYLRLYLDDDHDGRPTPSGWTRAYDVDEAISILSQHDGPFEVSLDHDLGVDEAGNEKPNGTALVSWMTEHERYPENAQIHSANPVGRKNIQHDLNFMDRMRSSSVKKSHWSDVFAKAKRLKDTGQVIIQRNGFDNVSAMVRGDNGIYPVEYQRQDPNSRAISMWSCGCPWAQFVWFRTDPWKKYEGRVCSHTLAAYWAALGTPLDEDAQEQWDAMKQRGQMAPAPQPATPPTPAQEALPGGEEGPPGGPGATMIHGPEEDMPEETDEVMPTELPIEPDLTQGPLPKQPELPFKPAEPGGDIVQPTTQKGELPTVNPIEQGLLELQKQLGPEQTNFLKQKYPQFFRIPGTLSHVTGAAGGDFDVIYAMLHPEPGKVSHNPTCQMLAEEYGEMRGGINPVPGAIPVRVREDGTPIFHRDHMGWHPDMPRPGATPVSIHADGTPIYRPEDLGVQLTKDRAHLCPERRGDYGKIPEGVNVSIMDADPTTKWVLVNYPIHQDGKPLPYMQHRMIEAWVDSRIVRLVGSERNTPFIKRHAPDPAATAKPQADSENQSETLDWTPDEPSDDWA